jgi:hypothetical protein
MRGFEVKETPGHPTLEDFLKQTPRWKAHMKAKEKREEAEYQKLLIQRARAMEEADAMDLAGEDPKVVDAMLLEAGVQNGVVFKRRDPNWPPTNPSKKATQ